MANIFSRNKRDENEPYQVGEVRLLVKRQAIQHTRRIALNKLLSELRPNESKLINKYRNSIKRMLSKDGVDRWCSKVGRIIEGTGLNIQRDTLNENTAEWLSDEPFSYLGQYCSIQEWFLRLIIPTAIEDPNAIIVTHVYNPDFPFTPLSRSITDGGLPANRKPEIEVKVIPVEDIESADLKQFTYLGHEIEVPYGNQIKIHRVKFQWDSLNIYIWIPYYDEELKLQYRRELWYFHDFGYLPLNYLPGRIATAEDGNHYNESYLHPYFEYTDEFTGMFSDVQANSVQHLHAKVIMTELPCPEQKCRGGKIRVNDKNGNPQNEECGTCKGLGIIKDGGPYSVLVQKQQEGIDGVKNTQKAYEYITPPTGVFEIAWDKAFELLERAKKSVGLDLLLNLNESGVAKEHRLEDLEDLLKDFGGSLIDTMEVVLESVDAILNVNVSSRLAPKIIRPKKYDLKSELGHKLDYDNALPFDRYNSAINLIQNKYKGEDVKQLIYKHAFKYAPEILLSEAEFATRISSGIYQTINVVKRDNVVMLITEFAESKDEDKFLNTDQSVVFAMLDQRLAELTPVEPVRLVNANGE